MRGINLSYTRKGTSSIREAVSYSFILIPSSTSFSSSNIFGSNINTSGRIKGKSYKGVIIRR